MRSTGMEEIAFEFALEPVARPGTGFAADLDAELLAKLRAQGRRHDVERGFVQWRAGERVHRTLVGVTVFLDPALQEYGHRGLAARRRAEQQQQPPTHVRAGGGTLEIIDDTAERRVDTEQLALEQCARTAVGIGLAATEPAQHVPQVLVAAAGE